MGEKAFGLGLDLSLGLVRQLQAMGLMFFLDESFELSEMKKLWTRTLNLTRGCPPTDKTNQSPWVFLTVQGFLSENIRT